MGKYAIEINDVSKQYRLGNVGSKSFGQDVQRWWAKMQGKEDPFLKLGEANNRAIKGTSDFVWALQNIDFKVPQGEVLGIIGKNGAGKSTLLKLLSRVTAPTTGSIVARGRMASLLEVGTGFHPELTGRENIYLNGAILGMTKREIRAKLDEIIAFSGVERYIDTPVKRYSSGMYVRLAFAVAAHLEPEILVVDEVLAVGDADFQKKAIGKMKEVSKGDGRTVLFVSHNMASVKNLCTSGIVLENGQLTFSGTAEESVSYYLSDFREDCWQYIFKDDEHANEYAQTLKIELQKSTTDKNYLSVADKIRFQIYYRQIKAGTPTYCIVVLTDQEEVVMTTMNNNNDFYKNAEGEVGAEIMTTVEIPAYFLNNRKYHIRLILNGQGYHPAEHRVADKVLRFELMDDDTFKGDFLRSFDGVVRPVLSWQTAKLI